VIERSRVRAVDIYSAAERIRPHIRRTPLVRSSLLSEAIGREVFLKLEQRQRTGSFKLRGALNAVLAAGEAGGRAALITASAGNHGLGVAMAARIARVPATVFLPDAAPAIKRRRIRRLGAEVLEVPGGYDDAHEAALDHALRVGGSYVHAFSDPEVVAGQGTVALEILVEQPMIRTLLVPVGGGGLIGGTGVLARSRNSRTRLVGVQSTATAAMYESLRAGTPVCPDMPATLCDGLSGAVDEWSLRLAEEVLDEMVLVSEQEVRAAIDYLIREEGIVAEGSAAVVVACLRSGRTSFPDGAIAAVITGRNIDSATLTEVTGRRPWGDTGCKGRAAPAC
jgi:threonine dehydratase